MEWIYKTKHDICLLIFACMQYEMGKEIYNYYIGMDWTGHGTAPVWKYELRTCWHGSNQKQDGSWVAWHGTV